MRAGRLIPLLVVIAACNDGTEPSTPANYSLATTRQWSGGTIRVSSASLGPAAGLPVFTVAGDTLSATRVDDTTFSITLPGSASGAAILLREGRRRDTIGTVQVYGLHAARRVSGSLGYEPLVPAGVSPLVFVAENYGTGGPGLTMLDPATDQVTTTSGIGPVASSFGVMQGFEPDRFVVRDSLDQLAVWRLQPTPAFVRPAGVQGPFRQVTQLNDTLWLELTHHAWNVSGPAGIIHGGSMDDPLRVVFASTSDRVAVVFNHSATGTVPVFSRTTGDTAFTLPLQNIQGAAFSARLDRLYLGSRSQLVGDPDSLTVFTASTGQRLAGTIVPRGFVAWALAVDPVTERVYQVADSSGTLELMVYNGTTLQLEGRLRCPGQCGTNEFWSAGLGVDVTAGRIHVAYPGNPIPVISFDRLP